MRYFTPEEDVLIKQCANGELTTIELVRQLRSYHKAVRERAKELGVELPRGQLAPHPQDPITVGRRDRLLEQLRLVHSERVVP